MTALALMLSGTPGAPATTAVTTASAPAVSRQLSASDVKELRDLTPAQQSKVANAIAASLRKAGIRAGTGAAPKAGTYLAAKSWSWGYNRTDVWFIATWHDVRDGAILAAGGYCTAGLTVMGLGPAGAVAGAALCATIVGLALHMDAGKADTTRAGLWITLYWKPLHLASGTWAN